MDEAGRPIIECGLEVEFEFQCPKTWENLRQTQEADTRFCEGCQKNVYLCRSKDDLTKHLLQKHCIAADVPDFKLNRAKAREESQRSSRRLLGYPRVRKPVNGNPDQLSIYPPSERTD